MNTWRRATVGALLAAAWTARLSAAAASPHVDASAHVTFSRNIAPLLFQHCSTCHRPGGSAPFPLISYADVKARARQIVAAVSNRSMPPWKPEPGYGDFADSRRLSEEQIETFARWLQQGSMQGDPAESPPAPHWSDEWQLGRPDAIVRVAAPFALAPNGPDRMRNFVLPVPLASRRFVRAWEFRTNAPQVVHHATMVLDPGRVSRSLDEQDPEPGYEGLIPLSAQNPEGYFLGWTPGQTASAAPEQMAWRLDPGTDLVVMLHLRPSGKWESVEMSIALYLSDVVPTRVPAMIRLNRQDIDIAAGDPHYVIHDSYTLPVDVSAYSIQPHAHNLAREIKGSAVLPDGTRTWLIFIRDWDFHWQDVYRYQRPVFLPAGTRLEMEYVYDNSQQNRANPNYPPQRVSYGQRTIDEMGDLWIQVVPREPSDLNVLAASLRRKLLPQNITGYQMMLRTDPRNVGLHDDLALLFVQADNLESAAGEFTESLRLSPDAPAAHYNLGNVLLLVGRAGDAERYFRQALERRPEYGLACQGLALALEAQGRLDAAADQFADAVRVMPTAEVHYNFGVLRQRQRQFDAAMAEYRDALRLAPDYADAHFGAGLVATASGHTADAIRSFRAALAARPNWPAAQMELAWNLATSPDDAIRSPGEAMALAQTAIADERGASGRALDVLAAVLAATGRFADAATTAEKALAALQPADEVALRPEIERRLQLYRAAHPYKMPRPSRR